MNVFLKFYDETKNMYVPPKFDEFKKLLASILNMPPENVKALSLYYNDAEGDKIIIGVEDDYKEMYRQVANKEVTMIYAEIKENESVIVQPQVQKNTKQQIDPISQQFYQKEISNNKKPQINQQMQNNNNGYINKGFSQPVYNNNQQQQFLYKEPVTYIYQNPNLNPQGKQNVPISQPNIYIQPQNYIQSQQNQQKMNNIPMMNQPINPMINPIMKVQPMNPQPIMNAHPMNMMNAQPIQPINQFKPIQPINQIQPIRENQILSQKQIQFDVKCSYCNIYPILNTIYKCPICNQFYCSNCEHKYGDRHPHSLLKIRNYNQLTEVDSMVFSKAPSSISSYSVPSNNVGLAQPLASPYISNQPIQVMQEPSAIDTIVNSVKQIPNKVITFFSGNDGKEQLTLVQLARKNYDLAGFTDGQIEDALKRCNGNIDQAVIFLANK